MKRIGNVILNDLMEAKASPCIRYSFKPPFIVSLLTNLQHIHLTCKNHVCCCFAEAACLLRKAKYTVYFMISHQKHRAVISLEIFPTIKCRKQLSFLINA